jgi:hypothetical protein
MDFSVPFELFYQAIAADSRIGTTHISLYMALLYQWSINGYANPVPVTRQELMKSAKINARKTYDRCMNNLHDYGYIIYEPAVNSSVYSKVCLKFCENEN